MLETSTKKKLFYAPGEVPPLVISDCGHKKEKVYDFAIIDNKPAIVCTGEVDPQEIIDASRGETLSEICARFKGNTPIEKLNNAIIAGVIDLSGSGESIDTTGYSDNFVDNMNIVKNAKAAAKALPAELKDSDDLETIAKGITQDRLDKYIEEKIKALEAAKAAKAEGDKK